MSFHSQLKNHHFNGNQHDVVFSMNSDAVSHTFKKSVANLSNSSNFFSEIESAIMKSNDPIEIRESDEISALGQRGIWVNKTESLNWKNSHLLSQYSINNDPDPQIVFKKSQQPLEYIQELAIRYLKPPTPPAPGI